MTTIRKGLLIGIVGPCSSGKSTLAAGLKKHKVRARNIAQEHSFVKDMWQRLTNPDLLIYLQVSYPIAQNRRNLNWNLADFEEQVHRLRNARENADFFLDTNLLSLEEVLEEVLRFIEESSHA